MEQVTILPRYQCNLYTINKQGAANHNPHTSLLVLRVLQNAIDEMSINSPMLNRCARKNSSMVVAFDL